MPPPWLRGAQGPPFPPQPGVFPGMFPQGAFPGGFPAPMPFMQPPHPGAFRGMPPPPAAPSPIVSQAEFQERRERERERRAAAAAEAAAVAAAAARGREEREREEEQQRRRERDAAEAREIAEAREREAAKGAFKQLLLERGVVPGAAWDAELAKFCHDPRCKLLQDPTDRKARAAPATLARGQRDSPRLRGRCLAPLSLPPPSPTTPCRPRVPPSLRRVVPRGAEREGWGEAAQAVFAALTRADVLRFKEAQRQATAGAKAAALLVAKELLAQDRDLSADFTVAP